MAGRRSQQRIQQEPAGARSSFASCASRFRYAAVVVLLGYGLTIMKTAGWGTGLPDLAIKNILPEDLAMHNPHYEGFGEDGSSYNFTAKTAQQELANPNQIKLNEITGVVLQPDKTKTDITAVRGLFNHAASVLELYDRSTSSRERSQGDLTRATLLTKENLITSNEPVLIEFPSGNIRAKNMRLRQKAREATFVDTVEVALTPPPPDPKAATAKPDEKASSLFTPSNGPVNINAERLDVNDTSQVAVFTGNVKVSAGRRPIDDARARGHLRGRRHDEHGLGQEQATGPDAKSDRGKPVEQGAAHRRQGAGRDDAPHRRDRDQRQCRFRCAERIRDSDRKRRHDVRRPTVAPSATVSTSIKAPTRPC